MPRGQKKPTSDNATATVEKEKKASPKKGASAAKKSEKKDVKPVVKPAAEPVVDAKAAPQEVVAESEAIPQLSQDFAEFMVKLQQATQLMSSLRTEFRNLEKKATRTLKASEKAGAKRKRKQGNRSPSGFVKPTLISDELAAFLSKPQGTEMARTEVTREINSYIRANNLQDKNNGRKINADPKLTKLLKLSGKDELTYFNLQRYMSPHFAKANATLA